MASDTTRPQHPVTLVVDRSQDSQLARDLLQAAGIEYVVIPDRPDADGIFSELPAVFVPAAGKDRGELFRGLDRIRTLFLPRFRAA